MNTGFFRRELLPAGSPASAAARLAAAAASAAALTFLAFLPAAGNGFVSWDDTRNFFDNTGYRGSGPENLRWIFSVSDSGFYVPVTRLSAAADYALWGLNPGGWHLSSAALHAANAGLLVLFCAALLRRLGAGAGAAGASLFAALLFALHPLRAEPVAWASGKHDLLCAAFCLLTALAYLRLRESDGRARAGWYAASGLAFALALLSKPTALALPPALLALDALLYRREGAAAALRGAAAGKLHLLLLCLPAALATLRGHHAAGSTYTLESFTLAQRLALAAYNAAFYLKKTVLPSDLSPLYQLDIGLRPGAWPYLPSILGVLLLTALLAAAWRRGLRGPLCAWAAYLLLLAPVSGLAQSGYQAAADRYSYLASLPLAAAAAWAALRASPRPAAALALAAGLLLPLAALAGAQVSVWKDSVTLWSRAEKVRPGATYVLDNLGDALADAGSPLQAIPYYRRALALNPGFAEAHNDLATALFETGDSAGALLHFGEALRLKPDYELARHNLANIQLFALGRPAEALANFRFLSARKPGEAAYQAKAGLALLRLGDAAGAEKSFAAALAADPRNPLAREGAKALRRAGRR